MADNRCAAAKARRMAVHTEPCFCAGSIPVEAFSVGGCSNALDMANAFINGTYKFIGVIFFCFKEFDTAGILGEKEIFW